MMETQARYILVGLFSVLVIVGAFLFVYWIKNTSQLVDYAVYQVRYEGSVSGLRPGAAVLFNGIRVGNVTKLRLTADNPNVVMAIINVDRSAPVRADTRAGIDFQGLLGAPSVSLIGGSGNEVPQPARDGGLPTLNADPLASRELTAAARETLRQIEKVIADNADPLNRTLTDLSEFSQTLARNSGRVDTILSGIERMTGGAPAKAQLHIYALDAPKAVTLAKVPSEQLVVAEPVVPVVLDTQKVLVTPPNNDGKPPTPDEGQWADSLPKLIQSKIIESFENGGYLRVGRPTDNLATDRQLLMEIRKFEVSATPEPTADVALTAKIVSNGTVESARIFRETLRVLETGPAGAAAALNQAFGKIAADLVVWAAAAVEAPDHQPASRP